jgi:hypothetical protein
MPTLLTRSKALLLAVMVLIAVAWVSAALALLVRPVLVALEPPAVLAAQPERYPATQATIILLMDSAPASPDGRAGSSLVELVQQQAVGGEMADPTNEPRLLLFTPAPRAAVGAGSHAVEPEWLANVQVIPPDGWLANMRGLWVLLGVVSAGWIAFHQVKFRPKRPWLVRLAWLAMAIVASPFGIILYCLVQQNRPVVQFAR